MNKITVSELHIYPIKSCRGIPLKQAEIAQKGFLWDREFMLVTTVIGTPPYKGAVGDDFVSQPVHRLEKAVPTADSNSTNQIGKFLTQRQYPQLATVKVEIEKSKITLSTSDRSLEPITFQPTWDGPQIDVEIWRDRTTAIAQGRPIDEWFTTLLDRPCQLVRQSPKHIRAIDPEYAPSNNLPVSFSDGYPFLLTNTASLAELNRRLEATYQNEGQTLLMDRFRPNIVIETEQPFIEDRWKAITIGGIQFAVVKPCTRCIITTTDQLTGQRNALQEPLKTLSTFRKSARGILFGENLIPLNLGTIRVGDSVEVLE